MFGRVVFSRILILLSTLCHFGHGSSSELDPEKCRVYGPGLVPHEIVLPARYFFIEAVTSDNQKINISKEELNVELKGSSEYGSCRVWTQILPRWDGTFIVRYKMFHSCDDMEIHVIWKGKHLAKSPYKATTRVYADSCNCPTGNLEQFINKYQCATSSKQIDQDLQQFNDQIDFDKVLTEALQRFNYAGSYSFCNYVILDNKIYRRCYGQHVGFSMFMDNILLSLSRKTRLPDTEFLINLGDWPLIKKNVQPVIPMFSWCGSHQTADIVMPTYDITEATLECMGRVTLDMLSVQSNPNVKWENKVDKAFWRGRDSRRERLNLIKIARKYPDFINASLTNFFFFRDEEEEYGPKEDHISFFRFFDYKYQLNIDGTVAAYRFPYLLAGNSMVFKQDSDYYEHFYSDLKPGVHYVPVKADLRDVVDKVKWARKNDEIVKQIGINGRQYAVDHLLPKDIFCYHAVLFQKWSQKLKKKVTLRDGMELVLQPSSEKRTSTCQCLHEEPPKAHTEL